jgi:ribulose-phosphate 3-epimerase
MVEIAPSILAADFARLGDQIRAVEEGGAALIHCDVMDGHFVPNLSIGIPVIASVRRATTLPLDVHLMIENPDAYIPAFAEAGANVILVQEEACVHLDRTLNLIREHGVQAGVVLNPATPLDTIEEVLDLVQCVLIMSVNPGFGGQSFIPRSLDRFRRMEEIRRRRGLNFVIEVDGGITMDNVQEVVHAGVRRIVAGSSIFHTPDPREATRKMAGLAMEAEAKSTMVRV